MLLFIQRSLPSPKTPSPLYLRPFSAPNGHLMRLTFLDLHDGHIRIIPISLNSCPQVRHLKSFANIPSGSPASIPQPQIEHILHRLANDEFTKISRSAYINLFWPIFTYDMISCSMADPFMTKCYLFELIDNPFLVHSYCSLEFKTNNHFLNLGCRERDSSPRLPDTSGRAPMQKPYESGALTSQATPAWQEP